LFLFQIANKFPYIRLIPLKIITVKKTLFQTQFVDFFSLALLAFLLIFVSSCSKKTTQNKPVDIVETPFTLDSMSTDSSYLVVTKTNHRLYSLIECFKTTKDSIKCFAFNTKTQSFDSLIGYFNNDRAFEITNTQKTVTIRASFNEDGNGRGVISTSLSTDYLEMKLAPSISDSTFVRGKDSIFTTVNTSNNIEYLLTFPTFKNQSVKKNVIFSAMIRNSQIFFQHYIDSLNAKEFHFLKYRAKCKKIGKDIWNYEWFLESEIQQGIPLFEISFDEYTCSIISTTSLNTVRLLNNINVLINTVDSKKIDSLPFSNTLGISGKGITIYYPHRSKVYYPFQNVITQMRTDSISNNTHRNSLKKLQSK
jgi:hypothetical protein